MPRFLHKPLRWLLIVLAGYGLARMLLPVAVFDYFGLPALEAAVWAAVWPVLLPLALYEALVVVSAVLDHREAKLTVVGWREAWAAAHITVLVRGGKRAAFVAIGVRRGVRRLTGDVRYALAERRDEGEVVQLDPTKPFTGRIIEVDEESA